MGGRAHKVDVLSALVERKEKSKIIIINIIFFN